MTDRRYRTVHQETSDNIEALRWQLLKRLDAHPMQEWSGPLLRAVVDVIDLSGEVVPVPPFPGARPKLRIVQ